MDMLRGIVAIRGHPQSGGILGTGFFITGGLVLTCAHVIDPYYHPGETIYFQVEGGTEVQGAQVLFYSPEQKYDLAVLKPDREPDCDSLPLVSSTNSRGRDFTIYGYPRLGELRGFNGRGKVLGWTNDVRGFKVLQLDCRQVTEGFSGAPVWDETEGAVIGMLQKGIKDPETGRPSFALPVEIAKEAFPGLSVGEPRAQSSDLGRPRLFQFPPPPADFTGREEEIGQVLADFGTGKGAAISGLTGMGGIGKTALGLVIAEKLAKEYPDAQIFLDLKGTTAPLSAADAMRYVVLSFEPASDVGSLDEAGLSAAYRSVLHGKRALLFFDNARSTEQVTPLRPPASCGMLVTSRWTFPVPGLSAHRVDVMEEEEARAYLLELCPRIGDQAAELARACGWLPLAMKIAGSYLQVNPNRRVIDYLAQLQDRSKSLGALRISSEQAGLAGEPDLLAAFDLSYMQLAGNDRAFWRMLGVFPAPFSAEAAAYLWKLEQEPALALLGSLGRYGLLSFNENTARYDLHDLLARYAVGKMEPGEEEAARLAQSRFYMEIMRAADALYEKGGANILKGLRLLDTEWEHVRSDHSWLAGAAENSGSAAELLMWYPDAARFCLDLRLTAREQIDWLEAALGAARRQQRKEFEGAYLSNLGNAYAELGDARKAIKFHEQALAIARETGDRGGEGNTLSNLGSAYYILGETRKAIEFHEQALAIDRETGDRRGEGNALASLGVSYYFLGDARRAIEFDEQALAVMRETGDRRGEGTALGNLGSVYAALGDARKAIGFHEQQLAIDRELGARGGEGTALTNLGNAYAALGDARKAMEFYEQSLAILREIGDRRGEGTVLGNLGSACYILGDARKAIEFHGQALVIDRETGDRGAEGNTLGNLGSAYYVLGDLQKAIGCYEQQLAIMRETGDRRGEGTALGNLGGAYAALGDARKAIGFHEQQLAIMREVGDRAGEGTALGYLGTAWQVLGDARKAIEFHEQALAIAREVGDRGGEGTAFGYLGQAYAALGDAHRAIEFHEQALAIVRETGDRRGEGNSLANKGIALYGLGKKEEAVQVVRQALAVFEAIESPYAEQAREQLKQWGAME